MAGPYPEYPQPYPGQETYPNAQAPAASVYPGMLPPPVPYPRRRIWRVVVVIAVVVVLCVGITMAIVYGVRNSRPAQNQFNTAAVKTAIQSYLDALSNADVDTIARNTLCGMYDAVRDRRADQALAKLSSDAFRKQFSQADVTAIDKVVYWSTNQAQVLFTMRATPATRGAESHDEQAVAQVLAQDNQVLVCSYVPRSASVY
jgi:uncharacterized membrane protein